MNIIIMGPPGSGKGTQGRNITQNHPYIGIITGEMLRAESESGTELGDDIKSIIDAGNLVPDDMINNAMDAHLTDLEVPSGAGILFDGYPRTLNQATYLDGILTIDKVILLEMNEEDLITRILKRGGQSGREDDKDIDIIKNRMEVYKTDTAPVADHYNSQQKLFKINADRSINEVYNEILTLI